MKNNTKLFQTNIYFDLIDLEDQMDIEAKEIEKHFKIRVTEVPGTKQQEGFVNLIGEKPSLLKFLRAFDLSQMSSGEDESDWEIVPYSGS